MNSPLRSLGSNQVDFGGIKRPASATAKSSSMEVGYREMAAAQSSRHRRSSSSRPRMPPQNQFFYLFWDPGCRIPAPGSLSADRPHPGCPPDLSSLFPAAPGDASSIRPDRGPFPLLRRPHRSRLRSAHGECLPERGQNLLLRMPVQILQHTVIIQNTQLIIRKKYGQKIIESSSPV